MMMVKVRPDKVREACQTLLRDSSEKACAEIQGLRQSLLVESLDEPGRLIWISLWESLAEAHAYLNSTKYTSFLAAIRPYLQSELHGYGYNILEFLMRNQETWL